VELVTLLDFFTGRLVDDSCCEGFYLIFSVNYLFKTLI
jgi:hypothetical protein